MRKAGSITDARLARRFGDYLLVNGIGNRVDAPEDGGGIWIHDDDHLEAARRELEEFLADPGSLKYQKARQAGELRKQEEKEQELARKRFVDVRTTWARKQGASSAPITITLIIVCVLLFMSDDPRVQRALMMATGYGRLLRDLGAGQVWRLVTPVLMHGSFLHIGFNMLWLYTLGGQIERRRGSWPFVMLFLAIAILSNLTQYVWRGPAFLGMSGVVYGLFGYVWMQSRYGRSQDLWIDRNSAVLLVGWLVVCMTGALGPVANGAHVGGLVAGGVLGGGPFLRRISRR